MKKLLRCSMLACSLFLAACHDYDVYYESSYEVVHEPISLAEIDIIDSYGYSSNELESFLPAVNPYIDDGLFDILWLTYSYEPYSVEFLLGRSANILQAKSVYAQSCQGPGDSSSGCGELSQQSCFYTPGLELYCGGLKDAYDSEQGSYIGDLIYQLPQKLYFFVEVCEQYGSRCEYDVRELVFE